MESIDIKEIYKKYGFLIYQRCLRILGSEQEAKDAMQEVFLKLLNHYHTIRNSERVIAWIYNTAKNHCFNVLRNRKKFSYGTKIETIPEPAKLEGQVEARQVIDLVFTCNNTRVRDVAYYTYVEGLEQTEIRKLTGQSPATIRRNLAKFKQRIAKLKSKLEQE